MARRETGTQLSASRGITIILLGVLLLAAAGLALVGRSLAPNQEGGRVQREAVSVDQRMLRIADRLQCPVCEGQSVAFSESQLATEMRSMIAEKLEAGESEAQIMDYFLARYGVKILREPPRTGLLTWLWITPVLAFAVAALWLAWALWRMTREQSAAQETVREDTTSEGVNLDDDVRQLLAQYDEELFAR